MEKKEFYKGGKQMAVYATESYVRYKGDGVQLNFPIPFLFSSKEDIVVQSIWKEEKSVLQQGVDYIIAGEVNAANVQITKAPAKDSVIVIERREPQIQSLSLHTNSTLDLGVLEDSLDKIVFMIQEASQKVKKLQEEGELPTTEEYKQFNAYIERALQTVTTVDSTIEERYKEILALYEIIKDLANSGGGGSDTENTTVALTEHNASSSSHMDRLIPIGCVSYFMVSEAPKGWLILEKKVYKREEYRDLSQLLYCGDSANGTAEYGYYCSDTNDPEGSRSTSGEYFMLGPDVRSEFIRCWDKGRNIDTDRFLGSSQEESIVSHGHSIYSYAATLGRGSVNVYTPSTGDEVSLNAEGGTEVRPRNIALLACIKY